MMSYEMLKKYSGHASLTIWDKNDITNIDMFCNDNIMKQFKNDIIFVGLNMAGEKGTSIENWRNYHCNGKQDKRLKSAIEENNLQGRFITECFLNMTKKGKDLLKMLSDNPELEKQNKKRLTKEIKSINQNAILIALGNDAFKYLVKWFPENNIIKFTHHSDQNTKTEKDYVDKIKIGNEILGKIINVMKHYPNWNFIINKKSIKKIIFH